MFANFDSISLSCDGTYENSSFLSQALEEFQVN